MLFSSWNPLISTLAPPLMLRLTSCLIVPMPLLQASVLLSIMPIFAATSFASSGVLISAAVAISIKGMPSLERLYTSYSLVLSIIWQASSSRQTTSIPILLLFTSKKPLMPISMVLWNPEVFEPSITVFLITWTWSTISQLSILAT